MPSTLVTRTYLELRSPNDLRPPATAPSGRVEFVKRDPCPIAHYRELYRAVGDQWFWRERNAWSDERLAEHLASSDISVWELLAGGESAGYVELQRHSDGDVEIAYFGLRSRFIGRHLGGTMLTRAAQEAWAMPPSPPTRVWLHTCTLDSPHALPNYKARGFHEFKKEYYEVEL